MADSFAELLLRIQAESGSAEKDVAEFASFLKALGGVEADPKVEVDVTGQAEIARLAAELEAIDKIKARPQVDTRSFSAQAGQLRKSLENVFDVGTSGPLAKLLDPGGRPLSSAGGNALERAGLASPHDLTVASSAIGDLTSHLTDLGGVTRTTQGEFNVLSDTIARSFKRRGVDTSLSGIAEHLRTLQRLGGSLDLNMFGPEKTRGFTSGLQEVTNQLKTMGKSAAEEASTGFAKLSQNLGHVSANIGPFGARLSAVSLAIFGVVAVIGTSLVGALAALAGSFIMAAAAAGVLAAALLAMFGPIAAIAIPVFLSLGKIMKVLQAEHQNSIAAGQRKAQADRDARHAAEQHADGIRALQDALRAQNDAEAAATEATHNAVEARKQAYVEWADAIEGVKDARLSLERAELSSDQAALGLRQAQFELKNFKKEIGATGPAIDQLFKRFTDVHTNFSSKELRKALSASGGTKGMDEEQELKFEQLILNVRDARLREKEATDGVHHSQTDLARAREKEAEFTRKGIKASEQYQGALKAEASAAKGLKDAARRVADARRSLVRMSKDQADQLAASQTKVTALTGKLTASEQRLLDKVKEVWAAFKDAFGPGTQAIIDGLVTALDGVPTAMQALKDPMTTLGKSIGSALGDLGKQLTSPEMVAAFASFADAASTSIGPIFDLFGSLFQLFLDIAQAGLPYLVDGIKKVAKYFGDLAKSPGTMQAIKDAMPGLMDHLKVWLGLAWDLGRAFLGFLKDSAPYGKDLAKSLGRVAHHLADWLNSKKGRDDVHAFLDKAVPLAKKFAGFVWQLILFFIELTIITGPFLTTLLDDLTKVLGVINKILGAVRKITGFAEKAGFNLAEIVKGIVLQNPTYIQKGVKDVGKNIADGVKKSVKDHLHIGSPSGVTEDLGKDTLDGFLKGITNPRRVQRAVNLAFALPVVGATPTAMPRGIPNLGAQFSQRGGDTYHINLPPAPAAAVGDARYQATQLARELSRRGGG